MPTEIAPSAAARAADPRMASWRNFLHAHARLTRRLDEELRAAHGLSLAEYDALVQLASAPSRRLRMNVLADRVLLSRSGITRLVDRLEADGMVERSTCVTDARGAEAVLTRSGSTGSARRPRPISTGSAATSSKRFDAADLAELETSLGRGRRPRSGRATARSHEGCEPAEA